MTWVVITVSILQMSKLWHRFVLLKNVNLIAKLSSKSVCNSLTCLSVALCPLMVIILDHYFLEKCIHQSSSPWTFLTITFAILKLNVIFASRNKTSMYCCQYGNSLESISDLINYVGANELYILHCFGSSLICLDHINSIVSIYGYYVLRGHDRKQFVQIG